MLQYVNLYGNSLISKGNFKYLFPITLESRREKQTVNKFFHEKYLNSCLLPMETASFGETSLSCQYDETSYNGPSEAKGWFFIQFLHQSPFFQVPLDRFFFQINASYFCNFPWPSTSAWTFLNAGSIYVSYLYEKFQYVKTHDQLLINSIHNPEMTVG